MVSGGNGAQTSTHSSFEAIHDEGRDAAESRFQEGTASVGDPVVEDTADNVSIGETIVSAAVDSSEPVPDKAGNGDSSERPSDADILEQENKIREEEADKIPFVGDLEDLSALEKEYEAGSNVFLLKIKGLGASYDAIRRTRGDGNCFFRSFIFGYIENLVKTNDITERNRVVTRIRQWRKKMIEVGFQEMVFEDPMEMLIDQLNSLGTDEPLTVKQLELNMREPMLSNMIVMFLRFLTSCELQQRADFFWPFVMGTYDDAGSIEEFCRRSVEPMGVESDHIHITALTDALLVPLRVEYLDRSVSAAIAGVGEGDGASATQIDVVPEECQLTNPQPRVHVLYRPGHYDILYPKPL